MTLHGQERSRNNEGRWPHALIVLFILLLALVLTLALRLARMFDRDAGA